MLDESLMLTIAGVVVGVGAGTLIGAVWVRGLDGVLPGISFHFPGAAAGEAGASPAASIATGRR